MVYLLVNFIVSFLLGAIYSGGELLAKFKNAKLIFSLFWGWFYLIFNGILSSFAYFILKDFSIDLLSYDKFEASKVLLAGGSSIIIIRSWLISIKVSNSKGSKRDKSDEGTFMPLIQILLNYIQKEFDKAKAKSDIEKISPLMEGLDFSAAALALPLTSSNLLITMTAEDGKEISKKVNDLAKSAADNQTKLLNLGLILNSYIGFNLLELVVNQLKKDTDLVNTNVTLVELETLLEKFNN